MNHPWDRRKEETDRAWIAFVAHRDAGPGRAIKATSLSLGRRPASHRQLELWSSQHDWVARCAAWDAHVDQNAVQPAIEKARADMAERHVKLGKALQGRAAQGLGKINPNKLRPAEVAALAKAGVDIERVASGEPTEIQRHSFADETRQRLSRYFPMDEEAAP